MLEIVPMTLREANAFVEQNHRHHGATVGHKFSIGLSDGEKIVKEVENVERNGKHIAKEATNGIIYDSAGQIVHNGLLEICPFCGEMNNHFGSGGSVNIWTVGAIERRECTKCRKQFHKISLTVPPDETPEAFYLRVIKAVTA